MAADDLMVNSLQQKVTFQRDGDAEPIVFPNSNWRIDPNPNTVFMPNARDGVVRKPSYRDATGGFDAFLDEAELAPGVDIMPGDRGVMRLYWNETRHWKLDAIIYFQHNTGDPGTASTMPFTFELARGVLTVEEDPPSPPSP